MRRGIISGYFNPLHKGHLDYINAAKHQCDFLIVIINNDWQVNLKGTKIFMDENHRAEIIKNIKAVDDIQISVDNDKSVCKSLILLRIKYPDDELAFFNSGDRIGNENIESSEVEICKNLQIKYIAIPLPKVYSSSKLLSQI